MEWIRVGLISEFGPRGFTSTPLTTCLGDKPKIIDLRCLLALVICWLIAWTPDIYTFWGSAYCIFCAWESIQQEEGYLDSGAKSPRELSAKLHLHIVLSSHERKVILWGRRIKRFLCYSRCPGCKLLFSLYFPPSNPSKGFLGSTSVFEWNK